ncbi:family 43 glycosylhydrolase [Rhodocytophaga rosea]|uniref:Family 43 glycosylhydrolase n=1 Tax=Rhodocytophaga rosea TaxID=2704465 RepID=A0A6C0GMH5_9BACT|nr:family 43 glycosylhydrolase [Rhodocytophaga rosea]QHT69034.1 family 43 glycosylhydrolase [Rhodocytophaga rosea]
MHKLLVILFVIGFTCQSCKQSSQTEQTSTSQSTTNSTATPAETNTISYTNPVLPGDYADPSITKVGDTYWATATSSEWAPLFPLLKSKDLVHWETVGHVFPEGMPNWTDAHFWAPEISYENGKVYIYYTANKKGGNLCVGVASATNPEGPYTDHGPLVCQEAGSIDGFPIRDENGQLYLIWKEDGNSVKKPTPLWGQRMNEERTKLTGEKFELFRNDATWEGNLVEGPSVIKRGDYFYMFYAGAGCCGRGCTYATGVARSKSITGPWEKYTKNPILVKNDTWQCPGHGTVFTDASGRYFFLYHAYNTESFVYAGRQGLLEEFTWNAEGWPVFSDNSPDTQVNLTSAQPVDSLNVKEEFTSTTLAQSWQWPVGKQPEFTINTAQNGIISLKANTKDIGSVLAQRTKTADYTATTTLDLSSVKAGTSAGLSVIGDPENALGISADNGKIMVWEVKGGKTRTVADSKVPSSPKLYFQVSANAGDKFVFSWSADGSTWNALNKDQPLDGSFLPPWDRALRVGMVAKGNPVNSVNFDSFQLTNTPQNLKTN